MKTIPNAIFFAEVERLIADGQEVRLKVHGTSMRPFLHDGADTVALGPFTDEELTPGAIALFRYRCGHILHRIVRRDGENLTIQGDSVPTVELATTADVVAVVKEAIRPDGRTVRYGSRRWSTAHRLIRLKKRLRKLLSGLKRKLFIAIGFSR